jgi:predicted DNA-binding transcriptional regulator YafY
VPASLERALVDARVIALDYEDKDGAVTSREVEPSGLVGVEDQWYLVGHCRLRGGTRVFRVDRVRRARVLDEPAPVRPVQGPPDLEGLVTRPNLLE